MSVGREWIAEADPEAPVYAVRPPTAELRTVVDAAPVSDAGLRVLVGDDVAGALERDFALEARLAARAADGDLAVRRVDGADDRALIDADRARLCVDIGDGYVALPADDDAVVGALRSKYRAAWADATPYDPTAPAWDRLCAAAEQGLCPEFAAEFAAAVEAADELSWSGTPDPLELCLLVGGRNRTLLHDLSTWAGETGLASPSSCSRTKQRLVERGLLSTDRVPQGVGRPRQRLLAAEPIDAADPESLVEVVAGEAD